MNRGGPPRDNDTTFVGGLFAACAFEPEDCRHRHCWPDLPDGWGLFGAHSLRVVKFA